MFKTIQGWFVGKNSVKRYIFAFYIALSAGLSYLGHPLPPIADKLAGAFGVWALGDAIKKVEPK